MNKIAFCIYFKKLYLSKTSNKLYKYLWSDCQNDFDLLSQKEKDEIIKQDQPEKDEMLQFETAELAFAFLEKEKENFVHSDECVVAAITCGKL